ncbi:RHO protein GDP dissociation inhibitor [Macleaya cordata]|uniref:RHO protein GDP dissociation inhibitor n=1 Tax=Macleaya cordata TaxID=56857 RepID=A0A200Q1T5_MACCD|nr:RHO protein GDP dissociation inhibitor [Macleaya cordata]
MENGGRMEAGSSSVSSLDDQKEGEESIITQKKREKVSDEILEDEDDDEDDGVVVGFVPGPLVPLKEQLDKDMDDESLRRWKEKLLGCVEGDLNGQMEPEVKFHSIGIISQECEEINTSLPINANQSGGVLFSLKEGSKYRLKLTFTVQHNIVSGLIYSNIVWKGSLQVDQSNGMLGTYAPQQEPYTHILDEETTPSGKLARGIYSAKLKFEDDDKKCHFDLNYTFEIKKRSS